MKKTRYIRQIAIPELGFEGQKKLWDGRVMIVGCGALGSMVAMQLAGSGVGMIGLSDYDTIEISNLHRQFFFKTNEAGEKKLDVLEKRLYDLNPEITVRKYDSLITKKNAAEIFMGYNFIIDATDNPESKRLIGEICQEIGKSCCIGGVRDFGGQVITFLKGDSRFEEYFGETDDEGILPCSLGGVAGPAAAFCASIQAVEAIKSIAGIGECLNGKIFQFDLLQMQFSVYSLS